MNTKSQPTIKFATAGGTATFVDSRALPAVRVLRTCHFDAPDDEVDLAAWIDDGPEPGTVWESRGRYRHGQAAGLSKFRVKAVNG